MPMVSSTKRGKTVLAALAGVLALGAFQSSAVADDLPTREQMWQFIQQQQREIEALKNQLSVNAQQLSANTQSVAEVQNKVEQAESSGDFSKKFLPGGVSLRGTVEVEAQRVNNERGADTSDIYVSTVELSVDAQLHEWVSSSVTLLYEDAGTNFGVNVDAATITLGNTEKFPLYLTMGHTTVPFGSYETQLLSDTLPQTMGETTEGAAILGFEAGGFSGAVYGFNGNVNKTNGSNGINNAGVALDYTYETDRVRLSVGGGYLSHLADSDGFSVASGTVADYVGGYSFRGVLGIGGLTLIGEYVGASKAFRSTEVAWNGRGAKPSAWQAELGYSLEIGGHDVNVAASYQETDEALALGMVETRLGVGGSVGLFDNSASLGIEWLHDENYGTNVTGNAGAAGTGLAVDTATMRLAVEF